MVSVTWGTNRPAGDLFVKLFELCGPCCKVGSVYQEGGGVSFSV